MTKAKGFLAVLYIILGAVVCRAAEGEAAKGLAQPEGQPPAAQPELIKPPTPTPPARPEPAPVPAKVGEKATLPAACKLPAACPAPRHRLCEWWTHRPLCHPAECLGCRACEPCATPPLYTFFLDGFPCGQGPGGAGCSRWEPCRLRFPSINPLAALRKIITCNPSLCSGEFLRPCP